MSKDLVDSPQSLSLIIKYPKHIPEGLVLRNESEFAIKAVSWGIDLELKLSAAGKGL